MKLPPFSSLLALAFVAALVSCESSPRDNPNTMLKTESIDGTGPVAGPASPTGQGSIGGGSNSGGSGSGGPATAAAATTYSSGR